MSAREFKVGRHQHQLRLDRFLREVCPALSRGRIDQLLRSGQVRIGSRVGDGRTYVKHGQIVRLVRMTGPGSASGGAADHTSGGAADTAMGDATRDATHDAKDDATSDATHDATNDTSGDASHCGLVESTPRIVQQSNHLLVLGKPPGLPTVPTPSPHAAHLLGWAGQQLEAQAGPSGVSAVPGVLHRLDRDTSGILLFSLSPTGHRLVTSLLRARLLQKIYWGMIAGHLSPPEGHIDLRLRRDRGGRMRPALGGLPSRTQYRTLRRGAGWSLLELQPHTGRFHQLRAHLTARNHPLLGDDRYGHARPDMAPPRLWLHALRITLPPEAAEALEVPRVLECPLWPDLAAHLAGLPTSKRR